VRDFGRGWPDSFGFFSSSIQAERDNPYGVSKSLAENALREWAERTGAQVAIFRLKNVFGKWCRPNYNSVVATFCHNVARGLPILISDPAQTIELVYVDDVIFAFMDCLDRPPHRVSIEMFLHRSSFLWEI